MAKGSLRLDHKNACPLHDAPGQLQFESRRCRCTPRVIARINGRNPSVGYLHPGWKKRDLGEFEDKLADLRDPRRRKRAERSPLLRER
jgi:hypothetical protein